MTSPLERAAKVVYDRFNAQPGIRFIPDGPPFDWDDLIQDSKAPFIDIARAVITAIREPSEGMVEAGWRTMGAGSDDPTHGDAWNCWEAMIDEALGAK